MSLLHCNGTCLNSQCPLPAGGRTIIGATNPAQSAPGTIRGDLCIQVACTLCAMSPHGALLSDAVASHLKLPHSLCFSTGILLLPKSATSMSLRMLRTLLCQFLTGCLLHTTGTTSYPKGVEARCIVLQVGRNIIHGSDAVESAKREIGLWFSEGLADYTPALKPWIYE